MIPANLGPWAIRHGVTLPALAELSALLGMVAEAPVTLPPRKEQGEDYVQSTVRLEAPGKGVRLWRNNVGALQDKTGRVVRYGLANDSAKLNDVLKSSDLIGYRRRLIGPADVGAVVAQFVARECKAADWTYKGDAREVAQLTFLQLVLSEGGDAAFTTGVGSL